MARVPYRAVLSQPHVLRLVTTSMVARLPQGMSGLSIVLFLTPHLGYGRAGIATGVSVAFAGLSNVLLARAVDRFGGRRALLPASTGYAAATLLLAESACRPYAVQIAMCGLIGLTTPPISSVARGMWPRIVGNDLAQVVYGLEATMQELIFIAGPAIVALVAGLASPHVALIVSGLMGLLGAVAYLSAPPFGDASGRRGPGERHRVLIGTGLINYVLVGIFLTAGFSMTEISVVNFVGGKAASASAGVVLAVWSSGSLVGGALFGAAQSEVTDRRLARNVLPVGVGLGCATAAPTTAGLAIILFLSGSAVAPLLARLYTRIRAEVGEGSATEAFGWLAVGFLVGTSSGSALGGVLVDSAGSRWTFLVAGLIALCAAPAALLRRPVASSRV